MPRALKSDKFCIYAPKKRGYRKGEMLMSTNGNHELSVQDLLDFLKEKGIEPSRVPLPFFVVYVKPKEKYPPISPGTVVETTEPDLSCRGEWTDEGWAKRKWGVRGKVLTHHDSHGLCYDLKHEDGTEGCYNPSELKVL